MIGERAAAVGSAPEPLPAAAVLDVCDRLLNEVGRRRHLFAWLRASGSGPEDWIPVDAYYPGNRLVVICREQPGEHEHLFAQLIPEHGLRLLQFAPKSVASEPERALRELISGLGPAPARPTGLVGAEPPARERDRPIARAAASLAQSPQRHEPRPRRMSPEQLEAARRAEAVGLFVGIALVLVLLAEMYLDVTKVVGGGGHLVVAFGIALDACARALGTAAAGRDGSGGWAWACAFGGSPAVAGFALFQRDGPVTSEPAPLAGLVALLALGVIAFGLVILAL
jgi:hypothetical protein